MIIFGQCSCAGAAITPYASEFSRTQVVSLINTGNGFYRIVQSRTLATGQKIKATSRFGFLSSSPKSLFYTPFTARLEISLPSASFGHDRESGNAVKIGVPTTPGHPLTHALFYNPGVAISPFILATEQVTPTFFQPEVVEEYESTDESREYRLAPTPVGSGLPQLKSFLWRRSDLISGEFNGVDYLMTPEFFSTLTMRSCAAEVVDVEFQCSALDPDFGYPSPIWFNCADGDVEKEGHWLINLKQVTS